MPLREATERERDENPRVRWVEECPCGKTQAFWHEKPQLKKSTTLGASALCRFCGGRKRRK